MTKKRKIEDSKSYNYLEIGKAVVGLNFAKPARAIEFPIMGCGNPKAQPQTLQY